MLLDDLKLLPEVFQPRYQAHTDSPPNRRDRKNGIVFRNHVTELSVHLKRDPKNELDPITVLKVGRLKYLTDGHHRLAAYRLAARQEIPVSWFPGTPSQAVIEAGRVNFKIVAQSDQATKTQRAWDMVLDDYGWSRSQIVTATTVAEKTVSIMRAAKKKLIERGEAIPESWPAARAKLRPERDDDEDEISGLPKHVENEVADWTKRLKKNFPPLNNFGKAQMLALALILFSPKRAEDIAMQMVYELGLYEQIAMAQQQVEEDREDSLKTETYQLKEGEEF